MTRQTTHTQLTIRFDEELERRIRLLAHEEGLSLNQAVLRLLREGAGLKESRKGTDVVGSSLDQLVGTWSDEEAEQFLEATADFEQVDPGMWQ